MKKSRRVLDAVIRYRTAETADPRILGKIADAPQYFPRGLPGPPSKGIIIDAGAFSGDTILALTAFFGKNSWEKICAFEPSPKSRKALEYRIAKFGWENVEVFSEALWSSSGSLNFNQERGVASMVDPKSETTVPSVALDDLSWDRRVAFVKMDIEGSETEALKGAQSVILDHKPNLAISIYHRPEDYYSIPFFMKGIAPKCRVFLRHHKLTKNDTVAYFIL